MKNEFIISLLERLHLKERFEQITPSSMEGEAIIKKYKDIFERYGDTVSGFHNFLLEAYNSKDETLSTFAKIQSSHISLKCPKSWRFGLIMEQLQHSSNPINEAVYDDLKYLLGYNESDLCEAIARGAFKRNMQVGGLREIYESIVGDSNAKKLIEGNVMYHPISYVEVKNGKKYFMLEGKVYEDDDNELKQVGEAPSAEFAQVNNAVNQIPYNPDVDGFVCTFLPAAVNVTSNGDIYKDKEPWDVQRVEELVKQELEDDKLSQEQKIQEGRKFDCFKTLMESFHKLVKMDNITAVTNVVSHKTAYLFEGQKANYILTSNGISAKCSTLNEAVSIFTRYTGVSLRGEFYAKLNEELATREKLLSLSESLKDNIEKAKKVIEQCNEELNFCTPGTKKFQEFTSIKEDAEEYIKILQETETQVTIS